MTAPYYERAGVVIYCARAEDVLPTLEKGCVDLVLTDPPYNAGKDYGQHNDSMPVGEYVEWCREWFGLTRALCSRTIIFPGHGNLPVWWQIQKPSAVGCWFKPGACLQAHLGWSEWEPWLYWGARLGGSDVIRATVSAQNSVGDHPCPKPLPLMTKLLLKCKSEAVLDCFLGSGTTAVAAAMLGIRCIGIEREERFCEIAARRLSQAPLFAPPEPEPVMTQDNLFAEVGA